MVDNGSWRICCNDHWCTNYVCAEQTLEFRKIDIKIDEELRAKQSSNSFLIRSLVRYKFLNQSIPIHPAKEAKSISVGVTPFPSPP